MKNAFIIHGAYGNPQENWFPWLKKNLEQRGYQVYVPQFPTPESQVLEKWLNAMKSLIPDINEESILIGHSIGATFILSVLELIKVKPKMIFLVGGFVDDLPDVELNKINGTFYRKNFDWKSLSEYNYQLLYSPDDPYVPQDRAIQLAQKLDTPLTIILNAGHFNTTSGYTTIPELITLIDEQL